MADDQRITDAAFSALLDAKHAGVPVSKVRQLVNDSYDLNDIPAGPLSPNATDGQVNAKMRSLGEWGAML